MPLWTLRENFELLRELDNNVLWESALEGLEIHENWTLFKIHLLKAQWEAIVLCKWGKRPTWLNRDLLLELEGGKKKISGNKIRIHREAVELEFTFIGRKEKKPI